jgi:hypothetical protein
MREIKLNKIGADIEVFLQDNSTGEIVSAEDIIRGSKYDPYQFHDKNKYYSTSLDNVMAEFTMPPASNIEEWLEGLNVAYNYILNIAKEKGLGIAPIPAANLHERFLMTDNAQTFGCEPDFNAYDKTMNEKPEAEDPTLRSAGGHIHLGYENPAIKFNGVIWKYDPENDEERCEIIKMMDLHIGIPSVLMEPDNQRKKLYGKAGAYRPKEYGAEYRTVSNFYLAGEHLRKWAFNATKNAIEFLNSNGTIEELANGLGNHIREVINNNNKKEAKELIKQFNLLTA